MRRGRGVAAAASIGQVAPIIAAQTIRWIGQQFVKGDDRMVLRISSSEPKAAKFFPMFMLCSAPSSDHRVFEKPHVHHLFFGAGLLQLVRIAQSENSAEEGSVWQGRRHKTKELSCQGAKRAKSGEERLFYAGGLKILEFDEALGSGQGLFQQAGFSHEGDHLAKAIDVDLALHRQDTALRFEK